MVSNLTLRLEVIAIEGLDRDPYTVTVSEEDRTTANQRE